MEAFERSLSAQDTAPSEWTEFIYDLTSAAAIQGSQLQTDFQLDAIPYLLAFDRTIESIEVELSVEHRERFQRESEENLSTNVSIVTVRQGSSHVRLAMCHSNEASVAVPITHSETGTRAIVSVPRTTPNLFVYLPLVQSFGLGLPVVIHDRRFQTTEERDGLEFGADGGERAELNKSLLTATADLLVALAVCCSENGFEGLHRFLKIHAPLDAPGWLVDKSWYRSFQHTLVRKLATIPLVHTCATARAKAAQTIFPISDTRFTWKSTFDFGKTFFSDQLPIDTVAEECAAMASAWLDLLEADDDFLKACILDSNRLLSRVKQTESLRELGKLLPTDGDIAEALKWLNGLLVALPDDERRGAVDGLLPDQTEEGRFRSNDELARDDEIDESLKDILEALGDSIRQRLLHRGVVGGETIVSRLEEEVTLISKAKDSLKKQASEATMPPREEFKAACIGMFKWLAGKGRWSDLKDSLPIIVRDRQEDEALASTSGGRASLLFPAVLWPVAARSFWDAFPRGSVLSDRYAPLLDDHTWTEAGHNDVVLTQLTWSEGRELEDIEKYAMESELEGDRHSPVGNTPAIEVGRIALVGTETFYDALRGSRERASRFLRFVLEFVIRFERSWCKREQIPCECGRPHTIVPSEWLAWIRHNQWVPRRKAHDRLTTESFATLTQHDKELAKVALDFEAEQFLELAGINVLEQALLSTDERHRSELRRKLAQLTKLAAENPGEVDKLMRDIEARQEAAERWAENQQIGRKVEDLLRDHLDDLLRSLGVRVKANFVGYDAAAYLAGLAASEDVGSLELSADTLLAKIEIKATRSDSISMSYAQGMAASSDQEHFWLCVVPLIATDTKDNLTALRIESLARFVPEIGSRLSPSKTDLEGAVHNAIVRGFELEHVEEIRYRIHHGIWETDGRSVSEFLESVVATVPNS